MRKTVLKTKYTVLKSRTTKRKKMTDKTRSAILLIQLPEFTSIRTFSVRYHLALCKENWKIGKMLFQEKKGQGGKEEGFFTISGKKD